MEINTQNSVGLGLTSADRIPLQTLGQQDFLKLLTAQLTSQDPLNPQKDTDFIAQMAQFNTLDQTRLMQADLSGLRTQFKGLQANQFLGQWVSLKDPATKATIEGTVTEVRFNGGEPQVVVGDVPYDLSRVTLMRSPDAPVVAPVNPGSNAGAPSAPSIPVSPNQLKILPEKMGQILGSILQ